MAIHLTVKGIAGSHIDDTCRDMVELASRIQIAVECNFNGVSLYCKPGDSPEHLARRYHDALEADRKFATVTRGEHDN